MSIRASRRGPHLTAASSDAQKIRPVVGGKNRAPLSLPFRAPSRGDIADKPRIVAAVIARRRVLPTDKGGAAREGAKRKLNRNMTADRRARALYERGKASGIALRDISKRLVVGSRNLAANILAAARAEGSVGKVVAVVREVGRQN